MSMAIGATLMGDIVSKSPIPLYMGDVVEPTGRELPTTGFSKGTYNKEFEDYKKWI